MSNPLKRTVVSIDRHGIIWCRDAYGRQYSFGLDHDVWKARIGPASTWFELDADGIAAMLEEN